MASERSKAVLRWGILEHYPRVSAALDRQIELHFGDPDLADTGDLSDVQSVDDAAPIVFGDEEWLKLAQHVGGQLAMILRCAWPVVSNKVHVRNGHPDVWKRLLDGDDFLELAWREIEGGIDLLRQLPTSAHVRFSRLHDQLVEALRVDGDCWLKLVCNLYQKCIAYSDDRMSVGDLFGGRNNKEKGAAARAVLQSVGIGDVHDLDRLEERIETGLLQEFIKLAGNALGAPADGTTRTERPAPGNPEAFESELLKLTDAQRNVVTALKEAGAAGLTKESIVDKSGRGDAVGIAKRLHRKGAPWDRWIALAGKTGGRYRLVLS